jgi:ATP-dependent Lhr-like helicase
MSEAFLRLAPFIQEFIYRNQWEELRGIQVAACETLFAGREHLLLCSGTASGKTEAAFFPILTMLEEDPPSSVGALYVGPTKALINDQFERLNDLCREADIPVWHWHGDVSQSHKERLIRYPSGILQITPESLEALVMRRTPEIGRLFSDLRFVVIDEVHSLMRGDRGKQVLCLLSRIGRITGKEPVRVGLSATVGDPEKCARWLASGTSRTTAVPAFTQPKTSWKLSMTHFLYTEPDGKTEPPEDPGLLYLFEQTQGTHSLIFTNSREESETVTATLRQFCRRRGEPERFLIHHGNLSAAIREQAEERMKNQADPVTICATATLELGIDVGRLERAFQIDAPFTVSSFLQRMGRTGRRGTPPSMGFVMREKEPIPTATFPQLIPWPLLQGIALIQLYAEERWVEPPNAERYPFSLLYHQTMSTLFSLGELQPSELARRVLTLAPFAAVPQEDYKLMLNHLVSIDHIERTAEGGLIVGLAGERIVNHYKFYGVFREDELYAVRCGSEELGTLVDPPPAGDRVAIAGRVWEVLEIDIKRKLVFVELVEGIVPAYFGLCPGEIKTKVLERMHRALYEDTRYPYLDERAFSRLQEARRLAANAGDSPLVHLGGDSWCLLPSLGSYPFLALERFMRLVAAPAIGLTGVESSRPYFITFNMDRGKRTFFSELAELLEEPVDPLKLIYPKEVPVFDKYDEYLPVTLLKKRLANDILDVTAMREKMLALCRRSLNA